MPEPASTRAVRFEGGEEAVETLVYRRDDLSAGAVEEPAIVEQLDHDGGRRGRGQADEYQHPHDDRGRRWMRRLSTKLTWSPSEVLKNAFITIVDQMAEQILRTCHSFVIYSRDF